MTMSHTNEDNFTQFWSQMYLHLWICWLDFGHSRQWPPKNQVSTISS